MKIVVIGGTGLIGSKTVAILRLGGYKVVYLNPTAAKALPDVCCGAFQHHEVIGLLFRHRQKLRRMIMSEQSLSFSRRSLLATTVAVGAASSLIPSNMGGATEDDAIRPFRINIPEETLIDQRRRLAATRWPDRETVTDESQGVQLATMQEPRVIGGQITIGASAKRN